MKLLKSALRPRVPSVAIIVGAVSVGTTGLLAGSVGAGAQAVRPMASHNGTGLKLARTGAGDPRLQAVGQVNIRGYRRRVACTGTLIAPRRVLTAAHCIIDPRTRRPFRAGRIAFLAGVSPQRRWKAAGTARCVHVHPDYRSGGDVLLGSAKVGLNGVRGDAALIVLAAPMGVAPIPVVRATPSATSSPENADAWPEASWRGRAPREADFAQAGYPVRRRYALTFVPGCRVSRLARGLVESSCTPFEGTSGGPLLVRGAAHEGVDSVRSPDATKPAGVRWQTAGVIVARTARPSGIAVPAVALQPLLEKTTCP